jgi:hypothetical protein
MSADTEIFVMVDNDEPEYDFVTIDETAPEIPVFIDITDDEWLGGITADFPDDSCDFVRIDEDQIFISDFKDT